MSDSILIARLTGLPPFEWDQIRNYVSEVSFNGLKAIGIGYGIKAALDCMDGCRQFHHQRRTALGTGCVFGK